MLKLRRSQILRYGVAILAVAIALALKLQLKPWVPVEESPFLVFFVPVVFSAWYGGIGSGVLATIISAWTTDCLVLTPFKVLSENSLSENLQMGLFVLEGLLISALVTALQSAKRRADLSKLEAQQHEKSLRNSEEGFRLLVEGVKDYAICRLDPKGYIVSWNEGAQRIKGYRPEEIIGQHCSRFYTPEDIALGKPEQNLAIAADGRLEDEGWRIRKDGSRLWANVVITSLRDDSGYLKGFAEITRDITEQKQVEEEHKQLLVREQATRAVAEAATDMVQRLQAITDVAIAPLSLDELLHELLSRIVEVLEGDTGAILMVDEDNKTLVVQAAKGIEENARQQIRIPIGQGFSGRVALEQQPMIIEQDAHTKVYSTVLSEEGIQSLIGVPLMLDDQAIGVIHVGTLSPRHFTSDDVQMLQLVGERAALAIERARLYEAERNALAHAQEANRVKDEFLAIVSHELRTPMQSILGWAQMLRSRKLNETTIAKAIDTLERNAKQQVKIIDDILDASRIIRKDIRLHIIQLNVTPIIEAAINSLTTATEAKAIQIDAVLDHSVGFVSADPDRLQQIFGNLLSNAIKFSCEGSVIKVRLERVGSFAQIAISDAGEGISADFLPYVFEAFRQADSSLTRAHGGLGLGLTIVRYLVELHGGKVYACSDGEGKGATFTVQLPIVKAEVRSEEKEMSGEMEPSQATLPLTRKTATKRYI
jgi:PAS domain S-box-containing protein